MNIEHDRQHHKPERVLLAGLFALLSLTTSPASAQADDMLAANEAGDAASHGAELHDMHCVRCHDDTVYTRDDRRVKSIQALGTQVRRCRDNLGLQWFDEDTEAVVGFLNTKYYKF